MVTLKRCDTCGREMPNEAYKWLTVEVMARNVRMGEDPSPKDFCSWYCVRDYAQKMTVNDNRE